ncbi:hypothetical protein CRG98_023415 [Punica granatum]|uniref:Uncharacterized protein n=1 Tax=Punica granatum TaxID=22663 RepID=A0A2I0JJV7_PUNGR|nr:hypothetical protein CRG98_023415 [Punica granatum]
MGGYAIVELGQSYRRREATPEDMEGIIESGSQRWCRHWSRSDLLGEGERVTPAESGRLLNPRTPLCTVSNIKEEDEGRYDLRDSFERSPPQILNKRDNLLL